jgi:hypothetical protein
MTQRGIRSANEPQTLPGSRVGLLRTKGEWSDGGFGGGPVPGAGRWGLEMRSMFLSGMSGAKLLIIVVILLPGAEGKQDI